MCTLRRVEGGDGLVSTEELRAYAGVSYRQADYWTTQGWLQPTPWERRPSECTDGRKAGQGNPRRYTRTEAAVAYVMRVLVTEAHVGVARSALIARGYVEDGQRTHVLRPGAVVEVSLGLPEWPEP